MLFNPAKKLDNVKLDSGSHNEGAESDRKGRVCVPKRNLIRLLYTGR